MNSFFSALKKVFYHSNVVYSIRIVISLTGSTVIPFFCGNTVAIIPLTLGVVAAAITEIDTRLFHRVLNIIITLICFTVATFSVQLLFPYPWLFTVGLLLSTFGFTMIGALGQRYGVIAFGSLLIAAYTMLAYPIFNDDYSLPLYLLAGALWYYVVSLIESIIIPVRTTQQSLFNAFIKLAQYLDAKAALFDPDETDGFKSQMENLNKANNELVVALNNAKQSLFNRLKGYRGQTTIRGMLNYYFVAQDIHERASATHVKYQILSKELKHSDILFRFARIMNLQAKACAKLAMAIKYNQLYEHNTLFEKYFAYMDESLANYKGEQWLMQSLTNLVKNLQSIDLLLVNINNQQVTSSLYAQSDLINDELDGFKTAWRRLKNNFTLKSALFRHAIRISLVFFIGYGLIQATHLPHGYWIILTSLFVCQPNYSTTKYRLRLRVFGTIIGIMIGIPLTYLLPNIEAQIVLIILSGWLFFLFKNSQYAYATAFITLLVFFSFGLLGESSLDVAMPRLIATVIGCFIAWLAVSFIWPDWKFRNLRQSIDRTCHDDCHYLALIGQQYQTGKTNDALYRLARRSAHENNADLSSLISIMTKEPHINGKVIDKAFRFLTLNHSLISYISTLGAHRDKNIHQEVLALFDDMCVFIINALNGQQKIDNHFTLIRQNMADTIENMPAYYTDNDFLVLQQLLLILDILPEVTHLTEELK
ncbi:YccS family putative transporter [Orbaceae bacterium ac157xtp]